jgi:hypothetical protein
LASVASSRKASVATSTIDRAIDASTGGERSVSHPKALEAGVTLCASVHAVMVPIKTVQIP